MPVGGAIAFCVWASSLNYWRHPTYSWRRDIDRILVTGGIAYHLHKVRHTNFANTYYGFVVAGSLTYLFSIYSHKKSSWISTFAHILAHSIANVANCSMYYMCSQLEECACEPILYNSGLTVYE